MAFLETKISLFLFAIKSQFSKMKAIFIVVLGLWCLKNCDSSPINKANSKIVSLFFDSFHRQINIDFMRIFKQLTSWYDKDPESNKTQFIGQSELNDDCKLMTLFVFIQLNFAIFPQFGIGNFRDGYSI